MEIAAPGQQLSNRLLHGELFPLPPLDQGGPVSGDGVELVGEATTPLGAAPLRLVVIFEKMGYQQGPIGSL